MGVPPADEIVVADVHPARVADLSVNHHYLPVVPVVEQGAQPECGEFRVGERDHLHSGFPHFLEVPRPDVDVGDVFVYETDLHALPCLLHEQLLYHLAALVLLEEEILHMDMMPGIPDVLGQGFELSFARCYDLNSVIVRDRCAVAF